MMRGPVLEPVVLTDAEIAQLTAWSRRPKTARALAEPASIILASATGAPSTAVAAAVGVTRGTVGKWRTRFLTERLDGLLDAPRPGAPRTITDGDVEARLSVVRATPVQKERGQRRPECIEPRRARLACRVIVGGARGE
jgi:transposase